MLLTGVSPWRELRWPRDRALLLLNCEAERGTQWQAWEPQSRSGRRGEVVGLLVFNTALPRLGRRSRGAVHAFYAQKSKTFEKLFNAAARDCRLPTPLPTPNSSTVFCSHRYLECLFGQFFCGSLYPVLQCHLRVAIPPWPLAPRQTPLTQNGPAQHLSVCGRLLSRKSTKLDLPSPGLLLTTGVTLGQSQLL